MLEAVPPIATYACAASGDNANGIASAVVFNNVETAEEVFFTLETEDTGFTFDNSDTATHTWLELHQITLKILFI
ncbi:hypothetical protein HMPREF1118_1682 [Haemophilus parainfluenzae HK262]|nr:hypothetical protein HMPREF1118_1682 [Haemophilus parainfluenzae HK262]